MNRLKGFLNKIFIILLVGLSFIHDITNAAEKNYLIYNVKKHDTLYKILKKYKLFPIFGKKGYLKKTLELNPHKRKTKGNLIYPREKIKIPILVNKKSKKLPAKTIQQKNEELQPPPPEVKTTIELKSKLDSRDVILNWDVKDQQQPLSFEIQRSLFSGTQYKILSQNIKENEFKDTDLVLNNTYYYIVNGVDSSGKTITSNEVSILYSPIFFKSLSGKLNEKKIELKWDEYDKNNKATYEVKRATVKGEEYRVIADNLDSLNFTDESIAPNKTYTYMITAKSSGVEIANSNEISVTSYKGFDIPSAFKYSLGTSYLSYHEYNTQNNTDVVLNSSVSPSFDFKYSLDWTKEFSTYSSLGFIYIDLLNSSFYNIADNPNYLFNFHLGLFYNFYKNLYVIDDLSFSQDVIYKPYSNNNSLQKIFTFNNKISGGVYFIKTDSLKIATEAGYIFTLPFGYNPVSVGNGYELSFKINKQFSIFEFGSRLYYLNRNVNTPQVKSNINDFGIIGEFSVPLSIGN